MLVSSWWHEVVEASIFVVVTQLDVKTNLAALLLLATKEILALVLLSGELVTAVLASLRWQHELELFARATVSIRAFRGLNHEGLHLAFGCWWPLHLQEILIIVFVRKMHLGLLLVDNQQGLVVWGVRMLLVLLVRRRAVQLLPEVEQLLAGRRLDVGGVL